MRTIITMSMIQPRPYEEQRCCSDGPFPQAGPRRRPGAARRWTRKLRVALPSSFAVFRRTVATPLDPRVEVGTRVVTNRGREVGRVRSVLVDLPAGSTTYAVHPDGGSETAQVLLLPRELVRRVEEPGTAIVDEGTVALRKSA